MRLFMTLVAALAMFGALAVLILARQQPGPVILPVSNATTFTTATALPGGTCCADNVCWAARKNGGCYMADRPKF